MVFEAFRKLPAEQLDSNVLRSLEEMLATSNEDIQKQVLDLLKLKRVGKAASASSSLVDFICNLAEDKKE